MSIVIISNFEDKEEIATIVIYGYQSYFLHT